MRVVALIILALLIGGMLYYKVVPSLSADKSVLSELSGFPIYPGANFIKKEKHPACIEGQFSGYSFCNSTTYTFGTIDDFGHVSSWYQADKAASGWKCSGGAGSYNSPRDANTKMSCKKDDLTYDLSILANSQKTELTLQIPHQTVVQSGWFTYDHGDYTFEYPQDWTVKKEAYLNLTQISNPQKTVDIIISEGNYPYGFSSEVNPRENNITVNVAGKDYQTKETIINNQSAFVDFVVTESPKKHSVLIGTGYPANLTENASLEDYFASKGSIFKILTSLKFKNNH